MPTGLLPPRPDVCQVCATDHPPGAAHNVGSLYYQYLFYGAHARWPTWADAIAHCQPEDRAMWREAITRRGVWSEPEDGEPIAMHPDATERGIQVLPQLKPEVVIIDDPADNAPPACEHDTDGDGDCHLCVRRPDGCFNTDGDTT